MKQLAVHISLCFSLPGGHFFSINMFIYCDLLVVQNKNRFMAWHYITFLFQLPEKETAGEDSICKVK